MTETPKLMETQERTTLKVLALGMPRTGTNSICEALHVLEIPCYHGFTLIANVKDADAWNRALDWKLFGIGRKPDQAFWDALLHGYEAIADLPGIIFVEELLEAYPSAKVVLVERNLDKWYTSFDTGIISAVWNPVVRLISSLDPYFVGKLGSVSGRWTRGWFKASSKVEMQHNARLKYTEHYTQVRCLTPKERLLEFRLEDGWGPLCAALGKNIPSTVFPNSNDSKQLQSKIRGYMMTGVQNIATRAFPLAMAVGLAALAWNVWSSP